MRVVHCISGLAESGGGPTRSVPALARAVARASAGVTLATVSGCDCVEIEGTKDFDVAAYRSSFPRAFAASRDLKHALLNGLGADIYHGHGIWELPVHYMAKAARRRHRPYLIAPRGMLEPWTLQRSRWKKQLVGWLYQNRDLRDATCLHAITPPEAQSFRDYGLRNPIAIVPNGVDLAEFDALEKYKGLFEKRFPEIQRRPIILYLSRIHPKKGLLHLVEAWSRLHKDFSDWILVIAGPDQLGHRAEVERKVEGLGLSKSVCLTGPLYEEARLAALAAARVFVLPSYSEGFSMAVLEALACRLPVLITPGCNFPEVAERNVGVICEADSAGVSRALRQLLSLGESERAEMGRRGRQMVEERYTWNRVGKQMIEVYRFLLGEASRPDCVVSD